MVIEIPCICGRMLAPKKLNKMKPKKLAKILKERPVQLECVGCGEVYEIYDWTRAQTADNDQTWKSYA